MKFTERLVTFLKTLNPDAYGKLASELSLLETWKQFFFNYLLIFVIMLFLFVPAVLFGASTLQEQLASFDEFELDGNFSASRPIVLMDGPDIVVDLSENRTIKGEEILFTEDGIQWKRFLLFGKAEKSWDEVKDLTDTSDAALFALLLFVAPSLAFWVGILYLAIYLITIIIFGVVAYLVPKIWRHKLSFKNALKLSIFASTVMMLIELWLLPFYRNWWLPFLIYLVFLAIGIALVGDRELSGEGRKKKKHDIWH